MSFTPGQQELNNRAMLSIMKYLMSGVKLDGGAQTKFVNAAKQSLAIDGDTFKAILAEVKALKAAGDLQAVPAPTGFQRQQSLTASVAGKAGAGGVAAGKSKAGAKANTPLGGGYGGQDPMALGRAGAGPAAKKGGGRKESSLPPLLPLLGAKVDRYWPDEERWYEAVVTDFFPANNQYVLTYMFASGAESFEEINFDLLDRNLWKLKNEKINLLQFSKSPAVQNSSYLKPYLQELAANAAGPGGGASRASKKRRSDNDLADDDFDYM